MLLGDGLDFGQQVESDFIGDHLFLLGFILPLSYFITIIIVNIISIIEFCLVSSIKILLSQQTRLTFYFWFSSSLRGGVVGSEWAAA